MGPCCDLAPGHPDAQSWGLVNGIQRVGFEFMRHAGSAGGGGVHPTCLSGQPPLSRRSPHQTPRFSGLPSSPCPNMHGSAFLCLFIIVSQKNASLHFRLSVSRFFFTRCGSTNTHMDTHNTNTHTHPEGISKEAVFEALSPAEQRMWPSVKRLQDFNKDTISMPSVSCIVSMADPVGLSVWEWVRV